MFQSLQSLLGIESKHASKTRSSAGPSASPSETRARGNSMNASASPSAGASSYGGVGGGNDDSSYIGGDIDVDTEYVGTRSRTGSGYGAAVSTALATASAARGSDSPPASAALVPVFLPDDDDVHFYADDRVLARRYAGMSPADAAARLTAAGVSVADALLLARLANVYRGNSRALAAMAVEFGVRAAAAAADDAAAAARRGVVEVWKHPAPRAAGQSLSSSSAPSPSPSPAPSLAPAPAPSIIAPAPAPVRAHSTSPVPALASVALAAGTIVSRGFPMSSSPDALAALLQMARARVPTVFAPPTRAAAAARAADKATGGSGALNGYFYPGLTFLPAAPGAGTATSPEAAAAAAASRREPRPTSAASAATDDSPSSASASGSGSSSSSPNSLNAGSSSGHIRKPSYTSAAAAAAAAETAAAVAAASAAAASATSLAIRATGAAGTVPVSPNAPHVPDSPAPAHAAALGCQAVSGATAGGLTFFTNPPFDEAAGAWGEGHGPAGRAAAAGVNADAEAAAAASPMSAVAVAAARALAPAQTAVELSISAAAAAVADADAAATAAAAVARPPTSFPYPPSVFPAFAEALHSAHLAPGRGGSAVRLRVDVVKALTRGARFVHVGHGGAAVRTFRVSSDLKYLYWPHKGGPAARPPAGELPTVTEENKGDIRLANPWDNCDDDAWEEADLSDPRTHRIYSSFFRTPSDSGSIDRQFVGYRRIPLEAITAVLPGPQSARLVHAVETVAATGAAAAGVGAAAAAAAAAAGVAGAGAGVGASAAGGAIAETAPPLTPFTMSIHYVFPEPQPLEEEEEQAQDQSKKGSGGNGDREDGDDDDDGNDDDDDDDEDEDEDDGGIKGYGNDFGYGGSRMRLSAAKLATRGSRKAKKSKMQLAADDAGTGGVGVDDDGAGDETPSAIRAGGLERDDATVAVAVIAAETAAAEAAAAADAAAAAAEGDGAFGTGKGRDRSSSAPDSHVNLSGHGPGQAGTNPPSPTSASASRTAKQQQHGNHHQHQPHQQQRRVRMVHKSIDLAALDGNEFVVWLAGLALIRAKLSAAPPDVVSALRSLPVWLTLERRYPSVFTLVDVETGGSVEKTAETIALLASAAAAGSGVGSGAGSGAGSGSGSSNGNGGATGPLTVSPSPLRPVAAPRVARSAASALVPLGVIEAIIAQGPKKSNPMRWSRAYHLGDDGAVYDSLFNRLGSAPYSLFLVKDSRSRVFGGYCASPWPSKRDCGYFGTPDSFVFRVVPPEVAPLASTNPHHSSAAAGAAMGGSGGKKGSKSGPSSSSGSGSGGGVFTSRLTALAEGQLEVFLWQGQVNHHVLTESKGFGWGGGGGVALYVSRGLAEGRTEWCGTYQNPPLDGQGGVFRIFDIEVWVAQPW